MFLEAGLTYNYIFLSISNHDFTTYGVGRAIGVWDVV